MSAIVAGVVFLFLAAWAFARRRSIRRWWRTKPCPHPDCVGRLSANPLRQNHAWEYVYAPEVCEVCQGRVIFVRGAFLSEYDRLAPKEEAKS